MTSSRKILITSISQENSLCTCTTCLNTLREQKSEQYSPGVAMPNLEAMCAHYGIPPKLLKKKLPDFYQALVYFLENETGGVAGGSNKRTQARQILPEQRSPLTHFDPNNIPDYWVMFGVSCRALNEKLQDRPEAEMYDEILAAGLALREEMRAGAGSLTSDQKKRLIRVSAILLPRESTTGHNTDHHSFWSTSSTSQG